jgi:hypothetical protein
MPTIQLQPSQRQFLQNLQIFNGIMHRYAELYSNRAINVESIGENSSMPLSKVRLLPRRFSQYLQLLKYIFADKSCTKFYSHGTER